MTTPIRAKARVFASEAPANLTRKWEAQRSDSGAGIDIRITRTWVVPDCPYCHESHEHDAGPIQGHPRDHLGTAIAGCQEVGGPTDALARERWRRYQLTDNAPYATDLMCKQDAEVLGGLVCTGYGEPAPIGQEVTCFLY